MNPWVKWKIALAFVVVVLAGTGLIVVYAALVHLWNDHLWDDQIRAIQKQQLFAPKPQGGGSVPPAQ